MLTNFDTTPEAPAQRRSPRRPVRPEVTLPVLPARSPAQRIYRPLRRATEFLATLCVATVFLPVLVLSALAVKLTSRGPAFYTQVRTGHGGRPFTIFKLRTMVDNCESLTGPRWTIPGDPRVTPVGWFLRRTHLDELPQILNVLRGEMSLIGPRPERPEFVQELSRQVAGYHGRHLVLPGITGLAQVQLPPDTDTDSVRRKLLYDMYYVRHYSPLLDLRIAVSTVLHLLGLPYTVVQMLRLVPGPEAVEPQEAVEATPRLRRQAA